MLLSACAHQSQHVVTNGAPGNTLVGSTAQNTMQDAVSALASPLEDLGLRQQPIPATLITISDNPYIQPSPKTCATLKAEIAELDTLLGPDADTPKVVLTDAERAEQTGAGLVHDGIVGLVKSHLGFLPFRGILRKLTGADRHAQEVAQAYEAGRLRRAYLKGLALASYGNKCIAPLPVVQEVKLQPAVPAPADTAPDSLVPSARLEFANR